VARPVLVFVRSVGIVLILIGLCLTGSARALEAQRVECSSSALTAALAARQKDVRDLLQRVEAGPFYKELLRRKGKPESCEVVLDGDKITLSYAFRGKARLDAEVNPDIEFSRQGMQVRGISERKGLALLKETEKNFVGRNGCGVNWNRPAEELSGEQAGSRELVYRGDVCNCQARVIYEGGSVAALIFSSAC
jgi:hypothetical protein